MTSQMSAHDARAWNEIERWKQRRLRHQARRLLPEPVRDRAAQIADSAKDRFQALPGADQFEQHFLSALQGLAGFGARLAMSTVPHNSVLRAYQKQGHDIAAIEDIQKLELSDIDAARPRLDIRYTTAATIEGAAAGFAVAGGELIATGVTVTSAGAGAAPGAGLIIGTMAVDAAAVLLGAQRAVAHTAAYYGFNLERPEEQLFALGVLGVGTTEAGKAAAYAELNKVVQGLARRQTWKQLNQHGVTRIVTRAYSFFGFKITQRKLGQAIPVVGILLGAGLNARLLLTVTDDAQHLYRERFLREKYGLAVPAPRAYADQDVVEISEIIDAELEDDSDSQADPATDHEERFRHPTDDPPPQAPNRK